MQSRDGATATPAGIGGTQSRRRVISTRSAPSSFNFSIRRGVRPWNADGAFPSDSDRALPSEVVDRVETQPRPNQSSQGTFLRKSRRSPGNPDKSALSECPLGPLAFTSRDEELVTGMADASVLIWDLPSNP
jgi:hypothetical protein